MGKTNIQWCDFTFNPFIGCAKVDNGCANCYAETLMDKRYGRVKWGKGNPRVRTSASNWKLPHKWNKENPGARVFCASLADWLDDEAPIEWIADLLRVIHKTPNLDWLLLTKRPENWKIRLAQIVRRGTSLYVPGDVETLQWIDDWVQHGYGPSNIWIGTSVSDQASADRRIPELLKIPARIRFVSYEPALGPVNFGLTTLDWIIVGGESGSNARLFNPVWARSTIYQCSVLGIACFMKQMGSRPDGLKLRDPKGGDMDEWPEELRVREFPV